MNATCKAYGQVISSMIMGHLHFKVVTKLLIPLTIAHNFITDVCSADKIIMQDYG